MDSSALSYLGQVTPHTGLIFLTPLFLILSPGEIQSLPPPPTIPVTLEAIGFHFLSPFVIVDKVVINMDTIVNGMDFFTAGSFPLTICLYVL